MENAAEVQVSAGIGWIELKRFLESGDRFISATGFDEPAAVAVVAGWVLGGELDGAAEFFAGFFEPIHVHEQLAEIEQGFGVGGILAELEKVVLAGFV